MNILVVVAIGSLILVAAYFTYGKFLAEKVFELNDDNTVPAVEFNDGVDFDPIPAKYLSGQHFAAIAAAGPVSGPIQAGILFGWLPTALWILVGSIFMGGVHDMGSLIVSVRHKACGIAETMRIYVSKRVWVLFNIFIFFSLVLIIVAFTDMTTASFMVDLEVPNLQTGEVEYIKGGAVATASFLYCLLPVAMAMCMRYLKMNLTVATVIFLGLLGLGIWFSPYIPLNMPAEVFGLGGQKVWNIIVILYCLTAASLPAWIMLQPRGHLGGYFLYVTLGISFIGLIFGGFEVQFPALMSSGVEGFDWTPTFPVLFITVACGACSGFHSLVSSGTTSKQLARESDAKPVGYGMMLAEGIVALVSLACVMMLPAGDSVLSQSPSLIYANGLAKFGEIIKIPYSFMMTFGMMAFTSFVYDTLDVCARLGRYIITELLSLKGTSGKVISLVISAGVPLVLMSMSMTDPNGNEVQLWSLFWKTFGASNQMLAALALIAITVWLQRTAKRDNIYLVALIPACIMFAMSSWQLINTIKSNCFKDGAFVLPQGTNVIVPVLCTIYLVLAVLVAVESAQAIVKTQKARKAGAMKL